MRLHYKWECPICGDSVTFDTRRKLESHKREFHKGSKKSPAFTPGGTCKFCGRSFTILNSLHCHEPRCFMNPNRVEYSKHAQSEDTRKRISDTAKQHKKSGGYRYGSGRGKKGWYRGYFCDSSWELAFVIYNIEHNIIFERNYTEFEYTYNNEVHHYIPDWIIDNKYVEIKGYLSEQWDSKLKQFPKDKVLEVIGVNEIKMYLDYVINKYGKDFVKLYE